VEILVPVPARRTTRDSRSINAGPAGWKRAVILRNSWPAMESMAEAMAAQLKSRHGVSEVREARFPTSSAAPEQDLDRAAEEGDVVFLGVAT
jgi:hypothetical protein